MKKINKKYLFYAICAIVVAAILSSFVALIAIPSVKKTAVNIAKNNLFESYYTFPENGIITAENGMGGNKENSLLYVKSALQNNADCIEVDLCFNEKGEPYIASSREEIDANSMPLEYLVSYIGEELNSSLQRNYSINLHLTDAAGIDKIDEIIKRYAMEEHCFLTGINVNQASYIRNNTELKFYLDYEIDKSKAKNAEYASKVVNEVSSSGASGINCNPDGFSEILMRMLKENWLLISFHDVETEFEIINALEFSPNQIITKNPQLVRSILTEWNAKAPSSDIIYS